jgi:hypothetical protein
MEKEKISNEKVDKKIKKYIEKDTTTHLLSSETNKKRLLESIKRDQQKKYEFHDLIEVN